MSIQSSVRQVNEELTKTNTIRHDFQKNLLMMASTFLAVLIALHRQPSASMYIHLLWSASLTALSLGILSGGISLYRSVFYSSHAYQQLVERVKEQVRLGADTFEPVFAPKRKIFVFFERLSYVLLAASVIFFTLYAIVSDL